MSRTVSSTMIQTLANDWGVDTIFGIPGDGCNGLIEALRQEQKQVKFIQVRHEEAAAFAACAYAKFTGRLGVCLATSGPGAIHLLNGLYDAKMDGAPVLAVTGQQYSDLLGTGYQQEVDLLNKEQAMKFAKALMRGQPDGPRLAITAFRDRMTELIG